MKLGPNRWWGKIGAHLNMMDQDTSEIHEKTDLLCLMGHISCLDAAIEKSKDSFEILRVSALI